MEMKFPAYLQYGKRFFTVLGFIGECDEYKEGKGYIEKESGVVYIYSLGSATCKNHIAYFWLDGESKPKYSNKTIETKKHMHMNNVSELEFDEMVDSTIEGEVLLNEQAINDMNASTEIFVPIINEDDDFLKKLVKTVILEKNIDIKILQHRMDKKYGLTNLKQALISKTKMSPTSFMVWAELLAIEWDVVVRNNGAETLNPLKNEITYQSSVDKVSKDEEDYVTIKIKKSDVDEKDLDKELKNVINAVDQIEKLGVAITKITRFK